MNDTGRRILNDIKELAPEIASRSMEIESARRVPGDLVEALKSIGIFRMFAPQSHGGLELALPAGLEIIAELSKIDGSVGWTAMIGSGSALLPPLLPRQTYEEVYRNGPDTVIAGSVQLGGTAEAVAGGWAVKGRWSFASGCEHADWLYGLCVMTEGGNPVPASEGEGAAPLARGVLLPASDWRIDDTWYVGGLKGTGSQHISLSETIVPPEYFFDIKRGASCVSGPLYQGLMQLIPLFHCPFALGIAEGALEALLALARAGRQQPWASGAMKDSETFQSEIGRIAAELDAARAFSHVRIASQWQHAVEGTLRNDALGTEARQAAIWVTWTCVRIVDACFALGGGSALYESSPLQRQLRDLHAGAQHAMVQQRHYINGGKLLLDRSLDSEIVGN
jgi:indole-3-acetate monooxygenase